MAATSIQNETPSKLTLVGAEEERLVLAPLQQKSIEDETFAFDLERAQSAGLVSLRKEAPHDFVNQISMVLVGGGFWVWIIGLVLPVVGEPPSGLTAESYGRVVWLGGAVILFVIAIVMAIRAKNAFVLVARFTTQVLALAVILAIGVGLPAATIYFFGGGRELLTGAVEAPLALFGRLIQLAFISTASLLPVLLFFLFDRFQLGTLRKRLYGNLFRLDRSVSTVAEIDAKYGSQIGEAYGTEDQGQGRLAPGSRWPVLVCAFVITIGWIVALAPVGDGFAPKDGGQALQLLIPQQTALVFGFLGVYFFSLRLIAIRYARGDLKPKAYSHIMVRVLIVAVLSWVLDAVFEGEPAIMLVLAFLFGITPDEFFTWIKERFRGSLPSVPVPETTLPLTDLEGIDLYDRGRLESEGIVNIEGLAHHELIDLIIETRVPVPRLIDWIDQSILYLHLAGGSDTGARARLRDYGIRTATDLLQAWEGAKRRSEAEFTCFKKLLGGTELPYRLEVIRDALLDDEWMLTVRCWREDAAREPIVVEALPTSVEGLERWAERQLEMKRYGTALKVLDRALQIRDTAGTRRRLAQIFATCPVIEYRDAGRARDYAVRAFELAPDDHAGLLELVDIYQQIGDFEAALSMRNEALKIVATWRNGSQRRDAQRHLEELGKQIEGKMTPSLVARRKAPLDAADSGGH